MIAGPRFVGGLIVLVVVALAASAPTAVAAGPTGLSVSPAETTATTGDRVSVDIVVDDAEGGVGAWETTVNLSDGAVADIVDVRLHGSPGLHTVDIADDNDSVYFDGALADTNDTGRVSIATLTIAVTGPGQTAVDLSVEALGDEQGESYSITETSDGTIATADSSEGGTSTPTRAEAPTSTETPTSEDTGVFGDDDTETGGPDTATADSTPTVEASTPTAEPGASTNTRTATTNQSSEGERSATATGTAETAAPSTQTAIETSAPGFTGLASLVALLLGTTLLLRRR